MKKWTVALILLATAACSPRLPGAPTQLPPPNPPPTPTNPPPTPTNPPPIPPLVIDGRFEDWVGTPLLGRDPSGDGRTNGVDFTEIAVAHTDDLLVIAINLGKIVNLQSQNAIALTLSAGGPELEYDLSEREGTLSGEPVSHGDIGLVSMPTITSDVFEIALRRNAGLEDLPLFTPGAPVTLAIADPSSGGDEAGPFTYTWDNELPVPAALSPQKPAGTIRLVSYNVENDGLLSTLKEDHFRRILTALDPDVIVFQEIENRTAAGVEARMEEWLGGDWFALKKADLVTASRIPFVEGWTETQAPLHARIFPVMIEVDGRPLVLFNAHLFCCDEDAGRQEQADGFAAFVRDVLPEGLPFVLAGDLNLVGDDRQLVTLLTGDIVEESVFGPDALPDVDGSPLADLVPRHLAGPHTYTWFDLGSAFAPGRLDYFIYTDSLLSAAGFVFDPNDLPSELLDALGVHANDGLEASDHLPVVVDITLLP